MSTFTAVLTVEADGTVHVPVPDELRGTPVRITAEIVPVHEEKPAPRMTLDEALEVLRTSRTFAEITDPVAWQREIRRDRPLPGRD